MLSQLTAATSTFKDAETLAHGREESTAKKRGKTINKKWKFDDSYLPSDVNKGPYCVLCNRTFWYRIVIPVKLWHHFENNHLEFKEKMIKYLKCRHNELFKSQKLLQLFKLEMKRLLKHPTGFNF